MSKSKLGFIGIGLMGEAMVRRLLDRGYAVTVWNRSAERLKTVVPHGAVAAASPAAVAAGSDIVLMCLLDVGDALESCVFGPNGVASGAKKGQRLIDLSTADPARTREMAARLKRETGMAWIDAPLSGGPAGARNGTMTVMAGGETEDVEAIRPLMADMTGNFTHMGPSGAGQTTKLINQLMVGTGFAVMAEVLVLAEAAGIDAARVPACLAGGMADSSMLQRVYPRQAARAFDPPTSYAGQMLKDMKALHAFAGGFGLTLPMADKAREQLAAFVDTGGAKRAPAANVEVYQKT
jgi:3-hydroxyisobutyrate dehydrogenase